MPGPASSTTSPWTVWTSRLHGRTGVVIACAAAGALVVGIAITQGSRGEMIPLVTCSVTEFRAVKQQLQAAGLDDAEYRNGQVHVPSEAAETYRSTLKSSKLAEPEARDRWADVWQSATERLSQFSGSHEREAAREIARAQVIGRLLSELPDIADADVVWDETPATGWREPARVRATVYLKAVEQRTIGPHVIDAVRRAVAGSKANLAVADVVVMDQSSGTTYDGDEIDPRMARAAQQTAWYQGQIESALSYLPGVRVNVRIETAGGTESPQAETKVAELGVVTSNAVGAEENVAVSVSIPESTIRELAGLTGATAAMDSSRRREVYRSVEQHLHVSVREKVARLVPQGSSSAGLERIYIETLPAPPQAPPVAQASQADELLALIQKHQMLAIAVVTGIAAVVVFASMLRRNACRLIEASNSRESTPNSPIKAERNALSPHSPVDNPGTDSLPAVLEQMLAAATNPVLVGQSLPAATNPPIATPEPRTMYSGRHDGARRDILEDVLTRIEHADANRPANDTEQTAAPEELPVQEPRPSRSLHLPETGIPAALRDRGAFGVRSPPFNSTEASPEPAGVRRTQQIAPDQIESLAGVEPSRLRSIVRTVDVATWSRALYGTSRNLQAQILPHLASADASRLTADLRTLRPIRLREIDEAQSEVLRAWHRLAADDGPAAVSAALRPAWTGTP